MCITHAEDHTRKQKLIGTAYDLHGKERLSYMELRVAGVSFATLFSSISLSRGDVEGFLVGSIVRRTEQVLVDEPRDNTRGSATTQTTQQYVLRHFMVTGSSGSFYDSAGTVIADRLHAFARKAELDGLRLIGWFRTRKNAPLRLTVRESCVWRGLLQLGPRHGHAEFFACDPVCALVTVNPQTYTSALTFEYRFIDPSVGGLDPAICNLGSSSAQEYRALSVTWAHANTLPASAYSPNIAPSSAIAALEKAHAAALANMGDLARRAQEAQQQCVDLEAEIASMHKRIAHEAEEVVD